MLAAEDAAPAWKAGAAAVKITPERRLHMAGYAGRKEPAEGTQQDLFAKALALEDSQGNRAVFITLDLIGVLEELRAAVAAELAEKHKLPNEALLMNASHTHCGPAYGRDDARDYFASLKQAVIGVANQALERLEPATLSYCVARCGFAMNRRTPTADGFRNHPNPNGPVDHSVPVLRVGAADGELRRLCLATPATTRPWAFKNGWATTPAMPRSISSRITPA